MNKKYFAVSRPELSKAELIAIIIELEKSNPDYDQLSYLLVSNGIVQVVSGIGDKNHQPGTAIGEPEILKLSLLDEWMKNTPSWSCGDYIDTFKGQPTFAKPGIISNLKKARERVFGDI